MADMLFNVIIFYDVKRGNKIPAIPVHHGLYCFVALYNLYGGFNSEVQLL